MAGCAMVRLLSWNPSTSGTKFDFTAIKTQKTGVSLALTPVYRLPFYLLKLDLIIPTDAAPIDRPPVDAAPVYRTPINTSPVHLTPIDAAPLNGIVSRPKELVGCNACVRRFDAVAMNSRINIQIARPRGTGFWPVERRRCCHQAIFYLVGR